MKFCGICLALLMWTAFDQTSHAQNMDQGSTARQTSFNDPVDSPNKKVAFRLSSWKTIHSDSESAANESITTLKKIGCEVVSNNHGNHTDVRYRCVDWKAMELPTDQLAAQWSSWLIAKGMETVVVDPPADTKRPTVQYRLPTTKTLHIHDPAKAREMISTLQLIGVAVTTSNHGNHTDASFQCPQWKTIELPTDENAHAWQTWLKDAGFDTRHSH